jgi:TP901 family phage tail tape measure protein
VAKQDVELKFSLIDGVSRGLAQIQQGVSGLGASLVKVNAAAELTGRAFGALGSIAGAFGDAVSGAASVEDALRRVSIITRATTDEQSALQQAVSDAVATTRFSAEEAAGALVLMAEDGFTASQAVQQLGTVLQFAQANAQSAAQAAQGLGAVLDTFGAPATQIASLADALTATAVAAGTSTKALQEGLAGAGVAAEQAGLSINDTVAALGGLAQRGIEGGAAAKALNKILADSENPASKLGKALTDAGLAGKSFGEIVGILSNDASKAAPILASLGNKPAAALKALLTEGGGALVEFNKIIDQSTGATASAADALNTTFLGALTRLQNQLVEARNQFLTPLLAPLAAEFEAFSAKIAAFTSSDQFRILSGQFAEFVINGVGALGDKLAQIDFNDVASKISNFATGAGDTIQKLKTIIDGAAAAIVAVGDAAKLTADILNGDFFAGEANWNRYNLAVARGTKGLDDHQKSLQAARDAAKKFQAQAVATASGTDTFGNSLDQLGTAATRANEDLRKVPEAAKLTEVGVGAAAAAASSAAQSIDQLEASLAAVKKQLEAAPVGSPEFIALSQQAAELEAKIKGARAAIDDATGANDKLANSANSAAVMRKFLSFPPETDKDRSDTRKAHRNIEIMKSGKRYSERLKDKSDSAGNKEVAGAIIKGVGYAVGFSGGLGHSPKTIAAGAGMVITGSAMQSMGRRERVGLNRKAIAVDYFARRGRLDNTSGVPYVVGQNASIAFAKANRDFSARLQMPPTKALEPRAGEFYDRTRRDPRSGKTIHEKVRNPNAR